MAQFSTEWLHVSEPFPAVFHVELARKPVNAFSTDYWRSYGKLFDNLSEAHASGLDIRAVVVSSELPKLFTAGLDLTTAAAVGDAVSPSQQDSARASLGIRNVLRDFQHAIGAPDRCAFPVIAAVHGPAIGLGVDLIAACDVRYASKDAVFAIKEVDIGLAPDVGTLAYLPKLTGNLSLVHELTYTGRPFSAAEAAQLGLVSKVVDGGKEGVVKAALELARTIASKSPIAVAGSKHLIIHSRDHSVADNLLYTGAWNASQLMTKDIGESVRAMQAKEAPRFGALRDPTPKL